MKRLVMLMSLLLSLLCIFSLCSCSEEAGTLSIDYVNDSSHDIQFEGSRSEDLPKGTTLRMSDSAIGCIPKPNDLWRGTSFIVYDNSVKIHVDMTIRPLGVLEYRKNYETVESTPEYLHLRYTFTDADYQYALEHGTLIE